MNSSEPFINKYQPKFFADFELNPDFLNMLQTIILLDSINILFIGNVGCGKTSLLNAMIREYYKEHINDKNFELNVLYINSLKDQGINYYRTEVKTFCQTSCSIQNKKKIIVIDDIDLINEQSQQVFRNCIDKYSNNVHFISSCNNIQKVIENLQSRFNIIKIKPLQKNNLYNIMKKIIQNENITIDTDAEEFLLNISNNTVKMLINYMEKCKLINKHITYDLANNMCTNISFVTFTNYFAFIKEDKYKESINLLYSIYDNGYSVIDILDNLFLFIKITDILTEDEKYKIIPLISKYIVIFHNIHEDEIELALFTNNVIQSIKNKS